MTGAEPLTKTLPCGHTYHFACITSWIVGQRKTTCPLCRAELSTEYLHTEFEVEVANVENGDSDDGSWVGTGWTWDDWTRADQDEEEYNYSSTTEDELSSDEPQIGDGTGDILAYADD
eukprot:g14228.t1